MSKPDNTCAILTDTTLCIGCEQCVAACKAENGLGKDHAYRWQRTISDLSATRFTTIIRRPGGKYVRQQCRHCVDPACVSACIVGALQKTEQGPVIYDSDRCMGCRYCMMACPYGIPRYEWDKPVPYIRKCTMCYHRITQGKQPACTEACPEKATIFGSRAEMLAVAHERIKKHPDRYVNKVFGETEVGGTSVLYISDIPLGFLGWKPDLGNEPLPRLTWQALRKVPPVVVGMAGAMSGVYFIIGRRMKIQAQAALEQTTPEVPDAPPTESSESTEPSTEAESKNE